MKKVIRLTESDLTKIVRRVISEQKNPSDDKKVRVRFLLNNIRPLVSDIFEKTYIKEIDGNDKKKTMSMALLDNTIKKLIDPTINITKSNLDKNEFYYRVFGGSKRKEEIDILRAGGRGPKEAFFVDEETFKNLNSFFTVILKDGWVFNKTYYDFGLVEILEGFINKIKDVKYTEHKPVVRNYREMPNSKDIDIIRNK